MNSTQQLVRESAAKQSIGEGRSSARDGAGTLGNGVPRFVTRARVSHLLAIPEEEVRRISRAAGLGRVERAGNEEETYFTYDELYQVGVLAARNKRAKGH
jgi:hypothetical protein